MFETLKTPEATKLALLGLTTVTAATAFAILPKGFSVAVLTGAVAVYAAKKIEQKIPSGPFVQN